MPNFEREFSCFPERKINLHHYLNMTPEVSNIIKEIDVCRKNKNYAKAHALIKQNADALKKYIFDSSHYRTLEEEIYNTQVFTSQRQQALYFGSDAECLYNDVLITDYDPLIPIMTSNTEPSGCVRYGSKSSADHDAYKAFDGDSETYWQSLAGSKAYIGNLLYDFDNPVSVVYLTCRVSKEYTADASDKYIKAYDTTLYFDFYDYHGNKYSYSYDMKAEDIEKLITFRLPSIIKNIVTVQLNFSNTVINYGYGSSFCCEELQLFGYEESPFKYQYEPLIPTMTSNTAPYGIASCGSRYNSDREAYLAFDKSYETHWLSGSLSSSSLSDQTYMDGRAYLKYVFYGSTCIDTIVFCLAMNRSNFRVSYDAIVYLDIETKEKKITIEQPVGSKDLFKRFFIKLDNIIEDVLSITMRFNTAIRTSDGSNNYYCSCTEFQAYGYYNTKSLIPSMSSYSNKTTGYILADSSSIEPYNAFKQSSTSFQSSGNTTEDHYLQYNFYDAVSVSYITYRPAYSLSISSSGTYWADSNTVYFDLLDKEGNVLYTTSCSILADDMASTTNIYLPNVVDNVWSIRLSGKGGYHYGSETYLRLTCNFMEVFGTYSNERSSEYTDLIPTMTTLTSPSGIVTTSNSSTTAWKVFSVNTINTSSALWSETTGSNAYIQYEFENPVNIKGIEHIPRTCPSSTTIKDYFYETEVYFDLLNSDGELITTLSYTLLPDFGYYKHRVESDNIIDNVKYIKCRYSDSFVSTTSTGSPNYVYCDMIQAYGIE